MLHLTLNDFPRAHGLGFPEVALAQQLHRCANRRQRIAELVSKDGEKFVFPPIRFLQRRGGRLERRRAFGDALFELGVEPFERARLPIQLGEHADLRPQDLRHNRHRHVVHRTAFVAAQPIEIGQQQRRDENN